MIIKSKILKLILIISIYSECIDELFDSPQFHLSECIDELFDSPQFNVKLFEPNFVKTVLFQQDFSEQNASSTTNINFNRLEPDILNQNIQNDDVINDDIIIIIEIENIINFFKKYIKNNDIKNNDIFINAITKLNQNHIDDINQDEKNIYYQLYSFIISKVIKQRLSIQRCLQNFIKNEYNIPTNQQIQIKFSQEFLDTFNNIKLFIYMDKLLEKLHFLNNNISNSINEHNLSISILKLNSQKIYEILNNIWISHQIPSVLKHYLILKKYQNKNILYTKIFTEKNNILINYIKSIKNTIKNRKYPHYKNALKSTRTTLEEKIQLLNNLQLDYIDFDFEKHFVNLDIKIQKKIFSINNFFNKKNKKNQSEIIDQLTKKNLLFLKKIRNYDNYLKKIRNYDNYLKNYQK